MDKTLEMRSKIEAVFEHYAEQSEYYRRANVAQRIIREDRFYRLTMELLGRIIGPLEAKARNTGLPLTQVGTSPKAPHNQKESKPAIDAQMP